MIIFDTDFEEYIDNRIFKYKYYKKYELMYNYHINEDEISQYLDLEVVNHITKNIKKWTFDFYRIKKLKRILCE